MAENATLLKNLTEIFSFISGHTGLWEIDSKGKRKETILSCCYSEDMRSGVGVPSLETILAQ